MADNRVTCPDCGHGASEHRKGRSACRRLIAGGYTGVKADEKKPPTTQARKRFWGTGFSGWECGCTRTPEQLRTAALGELCEHCNGTGRKQPCEKCGQVDRGQTGEHPCPNCGVPQTHDS